MLTARTTNTINDNVIRRFVATEDVQGRMIADEEDDDQSVASKLRPIRRQRRSKKVPLIAIVGRPNVGKRYVSVYVNFDE